MDTALAALSGMSRSYHPNGVYSRILNKTFNQGRGSIPFVELLPQENTVLVNSVFASRRDRENIRRCFPSHALEDVALGYPDWYFTHTLRGARGKKS